MSLRWTKTADKELVEAFNSGLETHQIASNTGRTIKAIQTRLNRIGISITQTRCYANRICKECNKEERVSKSEASKSKFCSQSCAASHNNRIFKVKPKKACAQCSKPVRRENKMFCSQSCSITYQGEVTLKRWLNGEHSVAVRIDGGVHKKVRHYLIEKSNNECSKCGWHEVHPITGKVPLTIDHIDGNCENAHPDNLKVLCPNCHSLTSTYGTLNTGNGRRKKGMRT